MYLLFMFIKVAERYLLFLNFHRIDIIFSILLMNFYCMTVYILFVIICEMMNNIFIEL